MHEMFGFGFGPVIRHLGLSLSSRKKNGPLQVVCLKLNQDVGGKMMVLFFQNTRQDQLTWLLANVNESIYLIAKK